MSEKDRSRSLNQRRKRHGNVKAFPRWHLVNNSSSATIHHVALHSLNHSRQVAALTKDQHLKIVRWHRAPLPPPYALYEYINVDNCERPLSVPTYLILLRGFAIAASDGSEPFSNSARKSKPTQYLRDMSSRLHVT